ncbi:type I glyceraldehyde-3-phosphate dehydrogenase [Desulfoplanes formicivorans]|uniref:Glyceraldehyde-3-phosphate dehydrogenase n=1 Tax=Desulfoplanes formicivorans TaxID=1592317 RepID=A0A194AF59_9BACT|nr:type I glyceraldehyde-3-phosphate dehydrogenase [Desulfoplanes formicivorans]GAU07968.1 glyceraldehyde-3-phosphate dehydrogenase [Desulfoplanes formicivorans]
MAIRIGMNGFGRIGRYMTRLLAGDNDLELVVINAHRGTNGDLAHLLRYDSVHGTFARSVEANDTGFVLDGRQVAIERNAPAEWDWGKYDVDILLETTGIFKDREHCQKHLDAGAQKVIVSAPAPEADVTVVMGVNQEEYDPSHKIISNASCTTNCLAPAAKVIHDTFGIKHGLMTTIHSYTMSQRILDGTHKDLRRGRAAALSMIPTTTGAAKAVTKVIPALAGKLDGMAVRVPTPNSSLVDFVCELEKPTSVQEVNDALKAASQGPMNGPLGYSEEPLVSIDYNGSIHGGVVDSLCTAVMDKTMLKLLLWYDNEAGFSNQLLRLTRMVAASVKG